MSFDGSGNCFIRFISPNDGERVGRRGGKKKDRIFDWMRWDWMGVVGSYYQLRGREGKAEGGRYHVGLPSHLKPLGFSLSFSDNFAVFCSPILFSLPLSLLSFSFFLLSQSFSRIPDASRRMGASRWGGEEGLVSGRTSDPDLAWKGRSWPPLSLLRCELPKVSIFLAFLVSSFWCWCGFVLFGPFLDVFGMLGTLLFWVHWVVMFAFCLIFESLIYQDMLF